MSLSLRSVRFKQPINFGVPYVNFCNSIPGDRSPRIGSTAVQLFKSADRFEHREPVLKLNHLNQLLLLSPAGWALAVASQSASLMTL